MLAGLGPTELIIILAIVLLVFGVGRIGRVAGELGSGIRAFREGIEGDGEAAEDDADSAAEVDKEKTD